MYLVVIEIGDIAWRQIGAPNLRQAQVAIKITHFLFSTF
jgi:hypothetical protein